MMERLSRMETTVEKLAQSVDTNNAYLSKQLQELLPQRSQANVSNPVILFHAVLVTGIVLY